MLSRTTLPKMALACLLALLLSPVVKSQNFAIKSNALYWATTTPNIGFEFRLGEKTTLDISGGYNPWEFGDFYKNKKLQHWKVQPELRLWHCSPFNGSYWGFHAIYTRYNMGGVNLPLDIFEDLEDNRYEGWGAGVGVSYGHHWYLGPHWNLETTFGFGYVYNDYQKFMCPKCGKSQGFGDKHYFGPTKIGVTLVYLFKQKNAR